MMEKGKKELSRFSKTGNDNPQVLGRLGNVREMKYPKNQLIIM